MNERIVELKKQAWEYTMAVHDGHIVPPLNKEVWPVDKVFDEKFAELIVKECAEVILEEMKKTPQVHSYWGPFYDGLDSAQKMINKHFGVEE